jgi:hypothetical protein
MDAKQKYEQCLALTRDALDKLKVVKKTCISDNYLEWVKDSVHDAEYYASKGDYVTALEAVAYAHGFIDSGVMAGFFEIEGYHVNCSHS